MSIFQAGDFDPNLVRGKMDPLKRKLAASVGSAEIKVLAFVPPLIFIKFMSSLYHFCPQSYFLKEEKFVLLLFCC